MTSRTIFNFSSRPCSALRHWDVVEYSAIADSGGARRRSALARSCRAPCHGTLQGRGLLKSHGLSETPIVWRNTSDTFTPRLLWDYYELSSFRLWTVNQFVLRKKVMVDAIPVLADNPRATVLVLVSLYLHKWFEHLAGSFCVPKVATRAVWIQCGMHLKTNNKMSVMTWPYMYCVNTTSQRFFTWKYQSQVHPWARRAHTEGALAIRASIRGGASNHFWRDAIPQQHIKYIF